MYDIKQSSLDVAIRKAFDETIASTPSVKVVAEGESFFNVPAALKAAQNMLQANPNLSLMVASDQGLQGTTLALERAGKKAGDVNVELRLQP